MMKEDGHFDSNNTTQLENGTNTMRSNKEIKSIGAWIPNQPIFQEMNAVAQVKAIHKFIRQGYGEYYYVMTDFNNVTALKSTEKLLKSADKSNLKIIIILLPPSEGGPGGNYDWKGWIEYFNMLKVKHKQSFQGFAIDDFNWISTRSDTRYKRNIDFMIHSNLTEALEYKRGDILFYPVLYFEGEGTNNVVREYNRFIGGIILASACYYNVQNLEKQIGLFTTMFDHKPTKYVLYSTITYNYSKQHYSAPSNQLVMATLSIAERAADGIIVWHDIDNPVVKNYLISRENGSYLLSLSAVERQQLRYENLAPVKKQLHNQTIGCEYWKNYFRNIQ